MTAVDLKKKHFGLHRFVPENIIVTVASFDKRVKNWIQVLTSMLNQTLPPDRIILNLAIKNFPNLEEDFPEDVSSFLQKHKDIIEIYWYTKDYISWKKHLHTIEVTDDNDLIVCIDDDKIYADYFIERLYMSYIHYGKQFPVTVSAGDGWHYNSEGHNGWATMYRRKDWTGDRKNSGQGYKQFLYADFYKTNEDQFINDVLFPVNRILVMPYIYGSFEIFGRDISHDASLKIELDSPGAIADLHSGYLSVEEHRNICHMSIDYGKKVLFEKYYKNDNTLATALNIYPVCWAVQAERFNYFKERYRESEPFMDIYMRIWYENFLSVVYQFNDAEHNACNVKYEESRLLTTRGQRINVIFFPENEYESFVNLFDKLIDNTIRPDYIVLYLSKVDLGIPVDRYPTIYELAEYLPENIVSYIIEKMIFKIRYYDKPAEQLTDDDKNGMIKTDSEYFDFNILITGEDKALQKEIQGKYFIETLLKIKSV